MRSFKKVKWQRRGLTLVELMIVVAIISILAAIGGAGFVKFIKTGKITKLSQFALALASGEEEFRSRQGRYYPITAGVESFDGTDTAMEAKWRNLLGFSQPLPVGVIIQVESGVAGTTPTLVPCTQTSIDFTTAWYCVLVTQDLNPSEALNTEVVYGSGANAPLTINEGF